jgi:cyclopropane fatty-acyl-phospholipid synthase-like methyltransferase
LDNHYIAMQAEYEEQLRWVGLEPGWHVLDAGCGGGSF